MTTYGYSRVSTDHQNTDLQVAALLRAGVTLANIVEDLGVSGASMERPGIHALRSRLKAGDEVVVYSISRLGRNTVEVLTLVDELAAMGVTVRSVTEQFDVTTPMGRAMLGILAVFSQLERETTVQRITAGVAAARARGVKGGRPVRHADPTALRALVDGGVSLVAAAKQLGIKRSTAQRMLKR